MISCADAEEVLLHDIFDPKKRGERNVNEPSPEKISNVLKDVINRDDMFFLVSEGKEIHDGTYVDKSNDVAEVLQPSYLQHHAFPRKTIKIEERRRKESLHIKGYVPSVNTPKKKYSFILKNKKLQKLILSTEVLSDNPSTKKYINPLENQEFNVIKNAPKVRRSCEDLKDEIHIISRMEERKTTSNHYGSTSGRNSSSNNTQQRGRPRTNNSMRKSLDINMSESSGSALTPRYIRLYEIARTKQMENLRKSKPSRSPMINQMSRLPPLPKPQSSSAEKIKDMMRDASLLLSKLQLRPSSAPNNRHNRLYDLSIKKQQEGRARREDIVKSLTKPRSSSTSKYLQVYEEAGKTKKMMRDASPLSSKLQTQSSSASKRSSSNRHNRLYGLSVKKQEEGRIRREDIVKLKQNVSALIIKSQRIPRAEELFKCKRNSTPFKVLDSKVLDKQARRLYERGMQSIISLERKRVVATTAPYKSPLLG